MYSRTVSSLAQSIDGQDHTPNTPDFPGTASRVPLLPSHGSHVGESFTTFESTLDRDTQNPYSLHEPYPPRTPIRRHPFASKFKAPDWQRLLIHFLLCLLAYPTLLLVVFLASSRPLFWTRTVVSLGCGLTGFALGVSLLGLGRGFLEAASLFLLMLQLDELTNTGFSVGHGHSSVTRPRCSWYQT